LLGRPWAGSMTLRRSLTSIMDNSPYARRPSRHDGKPRSRQVQPSGSQFGLAAGRSCASRPGPRHDQLPSQVATACQAEPQTLPRANAVAIPPGSVPLMRRERQARPCLGICGAIVKERSQISNVEVVLPSYQAKRGEAFGGAASSPRILPMGNVKPLNRRLEGDYSLRTYSGISSKKRFLTVAGSACLKSTKLDANPVACLARCAPCGSAAIG
jgi:hypothetical protein